MPRDSYAHERKLSPASRVQQDEFWRLRSRLCSELIKVIRSGQLGSDFPKVTSALEDLASFAARHPKRSFKAFRPEDLEAEVSSEEPLCLR